MRRKDDEKEQRIKNAVIKLMLQEGFHGTSISKIARMAEVSPATVYIYFESKEDMLQDIYREYSEEVFSYLLDKVQMDMDGERLIETLVRNYYTYMTEHQEVFSFVEQFSNCPAMSNKCTGKKGICHVMNLFSEMKRRGVIKDYSDENLAAILFYPVKAIAAEGHKDDDKREELLEELIRMIQSAVLI
ncbi:MAG: TetR/AcrR family transcriptional regulator [Clostridiaceae bacterium]|nr:TetR/AcrR family transcriptional regulator [Clostridiaceae bacterium]